MVLALAAILFYACENNTTEGFTRVTYYPTLELKGEPSIIVSKGEAYVDAGYSAMLNGVDVNDQVEVTTDLDTNTPGVYTINYKITNEDGFFVSDSRTVYVADPTPSIIATGIHTTLEGTQRYWFSSEAVVPFSGYDILILQIAPGEFYISDFMGGYYDQRVGYGSAYAMTGTFKLNADNTITALSSSVAGWGDSMDGLTDGYVDPETGQITYKVAYAGLMEYTIIMN